MARMAYSQVFENIYGYLCFPDQTIPASAFLLPKVGRFKIKDKNIFYYWRNKIDRRIAFGNRPGEMLI